MRGRWSFGVVVAIVVAICVATASHSDSVQLRIPRAHLTVTFGL